MKKIIVCLLSIFILGVVSVSAQAPSTFVYQGRLTEITGTPIADSASVVFTIYNDSVGGSALWSETHVIVPDAQGVFTVELGNTTPLTSDIFSGTKRYLGLKVGDDPEMTPRQLLTSGPYSINTGDIADNSVTSDKIANGAVGYNELAANAVRSSNVLNESLTKDDFVDEPGVAYKISLPTGTFRNLPVDTTTIDSIVVAAPAAGYIFVQALTNIVVDHNNGTTDEMYFQIMPHRDSLQANDNGFAMIVVPAEMPTQSNFGYVYNVNVNRPFEVASAGNYIFYFNAVIRTGGGDNDRFFNLSMTAMYFPSYYGDTPLPMPPEGH